MWFVTLTQVYVTPFKLTYLLVLDFTLLEKPLETWKRIFQPGFGVRSAQTPVKIYHMLKLFYLVK